jgi:hypothetical protein
MPRDTGPVMDDVLVPDDAFVPPFTDAAIDARDAFVEPDAALRIRSLMASLSGATVKCVAADIEAADDLDFDTFLERYFAQRAGGQA